MLASGEFPLWHGKVATTYLIVLKAAQVVFPLWHGKVATLSDRYLKDTFTSTFPLWHGKVATDPEPLEVGQILTGFRFGMVKLQPFSVRGVLVGWLGFRFGMVKLQPTRERRD